MDKNNQQLKTISIPKKLFKSMIENYQKWEEFNNEFEDFLSSSDKQFIQKIKKAKKEHQAGKTKDIKIFSNEVESPRV